MDGGDDSIPTVETYRGVGIQDCQPQDRIIGIVKPAIDAVYGITDPIALADYAEDVGEPPEARLFAAARCEAAWQLAAEMREVRPKVNLVRLRAAIAGLDSVTWRDRWHYGSLMDVEAPPGGRRNRRDEPLPSTHP